MRRGGHLSVPAISINIKGQPERPDRQPPGRTYSAAFFTAARFPALAGGRWAPRPRHGRRNRTAWPRASFRRRCAPAASGAGIERGGYDVGGDRLLDRGLDGPATLAGILDVSRKALELRVLHQRGGAEVKQPGRDDTATPPDFRDIRQVQRKALILARSFESLLRRMSKPSA